MRYAFALIFFFADWGIRLALGQPDSVALGHAIPETWGVFLLALGIGGVSALLRKPDKAELDRFIASLPPASAGRP